MICWDDTGKEYFIDKENAQLMCVIAQENLQIGKMYECAFYSEYIYEVYTDAGRWQHMRLWVNIAEEGDKDFKWAKCLVSKAEYRDLQIDEILK